MAPTAPSVPHRNPCGHPTNVDPWRAAAADHPAGPGEPSDGAWIEFPLLANVELRVLVQRSVVLQDGEMTAIGIENHWNRILEHRPANELEFPAEFLELGQGQDLILVEFAFQCNDVFGFRLAAFTSRHDSPKTFCRPLSSRLPPIACKKFPVTSENSRTLPELPAAHCSAAHS